MKTLQTGTALILFLAVQVLAQQPAPNVIEEQQEKSQKSDQYTYQQLQISNFYYENQLLQIRANRTNVLRSLEIVDPVLAVNDYIGGALYIQEVLALHGINLFDDPQFAETYKDIRDATRGLTTTERMDLMPRLLAIATNRFAEERNRIMAGFDAAELQLEQEQAYVSKVQIPQFSDQIKTNAANPAKKPAGMVSGILYSDRSAAIIGSDIVHQGDKLGSVRINRIQPSHVEFEKNGQTWTQKVGDAPSSMW